MKISLGITILTLTTFLVLNEAIACSRKGFGCNPPTPKPVQVETPSPSRATPPNNVGSTIDSTVSPSAYQANTAVRIDPNRVRNRSDAISPTGQARLAKTADISPKVRSQMARRGWTQNDVLNTVNNPVHSSATTMSDGTPGTAFFRSDHHHVIRNNQSKKIFGISDRTKSVSRTKKPGHFVLDHRIENPPPGLK